MMKTVTKTYLHKHRSSRVSSYVARTPIDIILHTLACVHDRCMMVPVGRRYYNSHYRNYWVWRLGRRAANRNHRSHLHQKCTLDALGAAKTNNTNNAVISGSDQMAEEGRDVPDPGGGAGGIGRSVGGSASVRNKSFIVSSRRVISCVGRWLEILVDGEHNDGGGCLSPARDAGMLLRAFVRVTASVRVICPAGRERGRRTMR